MTHKLVANENFDIVRGNQTVRVPFAATEPASATTDTLARLTDLPDVSNLATKASNPTAGNLAALDIRGNPIDSGIAPGNKLDSTSVAPVFSDTATYDAGNYVTHDGQLYRCTTAVTTPGAWNAANWTAEDMTSPDATLDVTSEGNLRLVGVDGTVLWQQGYDLAAESSSTLSCNKINLFAFADTETTQAFALPTAPSGKVGDLILDIDNSANTVEATATLTGLDATFSIVVPSGESLTQMLTFAAGEMSELYFTQTAFKVNNLPTWKLVRQTVENGGAVT